MSSKKKNNTKKDEPLDDSFYAKWDAYARRQETLWEMYNHRPVSAKEGHRIKIGG